MHIRCQLLPALLWCAMLAGCAAPGAPQPPSLELPRPVEDLSAHRSGDKVALTWTQPQQTTDRQNIRRLGITRICRSLAQAMMTCTAVGQRPPSPATGEKGQRVKAEYVDTLPPESQHRNPASFATYAVEVLNERGRGGGLSNQVRVPLAPTLPAPADMRAQVTGEGILISFTGDVHEHETADMRHVYRIYRRAAEGREIMIGEVRLSAEPRATFLDRAFDWEQNYTYRVAAVTVLEGKNIEVEG